MRFDRFLTYFIICSVYHESTVYSQNIRGSSGRRQTQQQQQQQPTWSFTSSCSFLDGDAVYVSPSVGVDTVGNGSLNSPYATIQYAVSRRQPCQTIYLRAGVYRNTNYDRSDQNGPVVSLSNVRDLKITNFPNEHVIVQFDGSGGFVGGGVSNPVKNLELSGMEIVGPNEDISYVEAISNRLYKRKRYTGRGVAIWGGDHIYIHDLKVHHCPGSGIRVNKGDYVTIADSEVYSNTWWSSSAESAIVFAESKSVDENPWTKMVITNNVVYDNVNKIPYYNPNYRWYQSPIGGHDCSTIPACRDLQIENCPWQCRYGKVTQDYIIDGSGVYVTRNNDTYEYGTMELSYNTCYKNGINGLVFHRTDRGMVKQNLLYDNGVVPRLDVEESNPQDWHEGCKGKSRQPYSGLVINNANNVKVWSNKVAARYDIDFAITEVADGKLESTVVGGNNKICRGFVARSLRNIASNDDNLSDCIPESSSMPSSACVESNYEEVRCGSNCHLIRWPYEQRGTYPAQDAKSTCKELCDSNYYCKAFSLQFDNGNNGNRMCFLYKEPQACLSDPFNTPGCYAETRDGQFFIARKAKETFDVRDVAT